MDDELKKELIRSRRQIETLQTKLSAKELIIDQMQRRQKDMAKVATLDPLTGLLNRGLWVQLVEAWAPGNGNSVEVCLLTIDVDGFKNINDQFGHPSGDVVLRHIAELAKEVCNADDLLARSGGDEFIAATRRPIEMAYHLGELIRTQIETANLLAHPEAPRITVSIGVSVWKPGEKLEEALRAAERCVHAAKTQGRNQVVTDADFSERTKFGGEELVVADLENRIRVATDRLARYLMIRSRRVSHHVKEKAIRDGLTGVYNRGYLDHLLGWELEKARKYIRPLTILMVDLDDFSQINKRFNWTGGDLAIKCIASIIQQHTRSNDWITRFGGDEFVVIMPNTVRTDGHIVAERIRRSLAESSLKTGSGETFQVTASIGVVEIAPDASCLQEIYEKAGTATKSAKVEGKNRIK
jgi:two-component system, cell cycle response regulator